MNWTPPTTLQIFDPDTQPSHYDDLLNGLLEGGHDDALALINANSDLEQLLRAVISYSPYLRDLMLRYPDILSEIFALGFNSFCAQKLKTTDQLGLKSLRENDLMSELRKLKSGIALACALADLGGWWDGAKITRTLSLFADASLQATFDFILRMANEKQQFDVDDLEQPQANCGLICLAMGKHGAYELNYSSDIDLILFYDEQAAGCVKKTDPTTFFARVARQLVKILQERTSDGYVFRVDLRLRPDPASTPPIMALEAALIYYEAYGQNWERAALIKARPAAGDMVAGEAVLRELTPFIWRKYLDYAAIQDVHSIKRQIYAHKGHATIATRGHNIKLGRGGIREVEFFAQTQQLIAGGRISQLRTIQTIKTLETLCAHQWIDQEVVSELTKAYWFLRDVEHRIQMVRDEQSHTLPDDEHDFNRIALMMGFSDSAQFTDGLTLMLQLVEKHYSNLFESSPELTSISGNLVFAGDDEDPHTLETLSTMGYQRPKEMMRIIKGWHFGRYPALRTSQAREMLTELTPYLLQEFAQTGRADETLISMDRFISGLPVGIQLFALLKSNPALLHLTILLLSAAPRLADIITRRPHVFDGLLDPAFNTTLPETSLIEQRLNQFLAKALDYESLLNRARIFAAEQKFLIGVRLINGTINAAQAGHAFSDLAQVLIKVMVSIVSQEFESKHGTVEGGKICVLAMGRLGSRELTAGSDLDLIFLYDHNEDTEMSDGDKPLHASQYFTRLTQRLTAAMSAPTAEGVLYELDFRLRPSGNAGPLATNAHSFVKYQKEKAWVWEKQALTRARSVAGDAELCAKMEIEIEALITEGAGKSNLKPEIADMRYRIEKAKGQTNPWDCKNTAGGLIDVEFIAQWMVLESGEFPPAHNRNSRAIIRSQNNKILGETDCEELTAAYDLYTGILQVLRSCLDDAFDPAQAPYGLIEILCQTTGYPDIASATASLEEAQQKVRAIFIRLIG